MSLLKVELPDSQIKSLIAYYENMRKEIKNRYAEELSDVNTTIEQLKKAAGMSKTIMPEITSPVRRGPSNATLNGYKPNWIWADKIQYVLRKQSKEMLYSEILQSLYSLEPETLTNKSVTVKSVSGVLSMKSKKGETFYMKSGDSGRNIYGLIEWIQNSVSTKETSDTD